MDKVNVVRTELKGRAMGMAEVIPVVSGGTIAFITGIYERLLASISSFGGNLIGTFKSGGLKAVWKAIDGNFLLALLCGMLFLEQTLGHKYAIVLEYNANKQISRDSSKRLSDTKRIQRYCRTEPVIFLLKFSRSLAFAPSPNHPPLTRLFHAGAA